MHYQRENIADFIRSIAGYRGDGCCGRRCLCSERYACARKGNPVTNMSLIVRLRPQGQPYCGARTSVKGSAIQRIAACIKRERERRYSLSIRKAQSTATSAAPIIFARLAQDTRLSGRQRYPRNLRAQRQHPSPIPLAARAICLVAQ